MRDQSGKCILQHVSQSIGTPSVMHCVGIERRKEGGRKRKTEREGVERLLEPVLRQMREETRQEEVKCISVCVRARARTRASVSETRKTQRDVALVCLMHSGCNESIDKSSMC